ncbi:MAG: DUF2330 domain-containing protein [Planctomycetales bacterium]|nr:DUF2330 domain-containing protein [Planctomycetales bacterium]
MTTNWSLAGKTMIAFALGIASLSGGATASADPCGMVPPITAGSGTPITRIGEQKTYVFHKDGVETFVIRPGFSGNIAEFGMLIPFPTPPAMRKVSDEIFPHIAAAIDPPEVVINNLILRRFSAAAAPESESALGFRDRDEGVRVIKQEAVGMYEVAVLEAGSAAALKRWMDEHQFRYPDGMDGVCEEYIDQNWCFVAVKTKVGQQAGVQPRPGQRTVTTDLPVGSTFDGHVQAMGFRFHTKELVVPMRLSAFNAGELRNIVYLLTDGPRKIRRIPEEYVVRQVSGQRLRQNVTDLLPIRFVGFRDQQLTADFVKAYATQRNPEFKNGAAKELFASDLLAVSTGELSLRHEEEEKELLRIGEHFGLRGADIDKLNSEQIAAAKQRTVERALRDIDRMTLTVVDGDFPREVLAGQNLTFAEYRMPAAQNSPLKYDATRRGPAPAEVEGIRKLGSLVPADANAGKRRWTVAVLWGGVIALGCAGLRRRPGICVLFVVVASLLVVAGGIAAEDIATETGEETRPIVDEPLFDQLRNESTATSAIAQLVELAGNPDERGSIVQKLTKTATHDPSVTRRGWAIAALAAIQGYDVDEQLLEIHADEQQSTLVRTWAAAARVSMASTPTGLIEKAQLVTQFPAIGRPIAMRLVDSLNRGDESVSVEKLIDVSRQVTQLQQSLAPAIIARGSQELLGVMTKSTDDQIRRMAAAYLGTLAAQTDSNVARDIIRAYQFDPEAKSVPWAGGALFVPGLAWEQEPARELVANLLAWHLWCDRNDMSAEQRQIHNNIRSLGLARAAGYESPGFRVADTVTWLKVWRDVVGRDQLRLMLQEQGVAEDAKYAVLLGE